MRSLSSLSPKLHGSRQTECSRRRIVAFCLALLMVSLYGCEVAQEPEYGEVCVLTGSPYERGFQHGERYSDEIRRLYTKLLSAGILPNLNREQAEVDDFLTEYQDPLYDNGQFSYQLMLQSAHNLIPYIPEPYMEEMQGIADGAALDFDTVLILNTFMDTLLSFRGIALFIKLMQAPHLVSVRFGEGLDSDGIDNDGDGKLDEWNEGAIEPYAPSPYASMVEVSSDSKIQFILTDMFEGANPESIRIQVGAKIYTAEDGCIQSTPVYDRIPLLRVLFTPPEGLPPASVVTLILQAGDLDQCITPPLPRARYMRDERITFTTKGYGKLPHEVENRGESNGGSQPTSIAFAVRGSATRNGDTLLAQHFSLLDSGTCHQHAVMFVHKTDQGLSYAIQGWTGTIFGLAGMNSEGVAYSINMSDTLDNALVGKFKEDYFSARLMAYGVPICVLGREILSGSHDAGQAVDYLQAQQVTFGWNVLLADRHGSLAAVEMDTNIMETPDRGFYSYWPDQSVPSNLDPWARPLASVGPDDLRIGSHFQANTVDIDKRFLVIFYTRPQRYWSSFYNRSLRAFYLLGDRISERYGTLDVPGMIDVLRTPDLVDTRDSMFAVVFEPERLMIHYAMGEVPATDKDFVPLDLAAELAGEVGQ